MNNLGISIDEFVTAVVDSYKKGFSDAIECLRVAETTIDEKTMRESILEILQEKNKIKAKW